MNYTTITINNQKVGLKFGMASFRYLAEKFVEGISYTNGELNEIGLSHLLYAGYYNNCLVKDVLPDYKFEQIVDYVESNLKNESFLEEMKEVVKVWGESDFVKKAIESTSEEPKKKISRGKK
jgi:hypothetical protein